MSDESGTSTYKYDENNRLTEIQKSGTTQITYSYDQIGNVIRVTDLKGYAVDYTYDKSSRMETVTYGGKTTTYTYDDNGRRISVTYEGGVSENYNYDKDNNLITLKNKKPNGGSLSEYSYTYDLAGRQLSKTDLYGTTTYEYDKSGRILKVATPGKTTIYAYDKAGNRVSQNETYLSLQPSDYVDEATGKEIQYILKKSDYTYSNTNQLLKLVERMFDQNQKEIARKTTKYTYDDNGNQQKQSISHTMPDDTGLRPKATGTAYGNNVTNNIDKLIEKTSYLYDGFNRLRNTETIKDGVRTTVDFTYNGDDLRVSKTTKKSSSNYAAEVTNYLYDRQNVIVETDANSNVKARYIKGINYIAKTDAQNNTSYYLFNGHGDVVQTVDAAGEVKNQYDYDIWGNPTLTVETTNNAIRYTGEFYDEETGLYYLRARYYDPNLGRFTTEDRYWGEDENPLSLNLYTYCENDPVQFVDPSGHDRTLYSEAGLTTWDATTKTSTFTVNGVTQAMQISGGVVYDSSGNSIGKVVDGHITVSDSTYTNLFGTSYSNTSTSNINLNVSSGQNFTSVYTGNGANVTISNSGNIGNIQTGNGSTTTINNNGTITNISTGDSSKTTVNNYSVIDTIGTGKSSDLLLNNSGTVKYEVKLGENGTAKINNYKNGYINNILGGDITDGTEKGISLFNSGKVDALFTGAFSTNYVDTSLGEMDYLITGFGNATKKKGNVTNEGGRGNIYDAELLEGLEALGFDLKGTGDTLKVKVYSALIIVQWYLSEKEPTTGVSINGDLKDQKTKEVLLALLSKGQISEKKVQEEVIKWKPEKSTTSDDKDKGRNNGKYQVGTVDNFVKVPSPGNETDYIEINTGIAWAMMIQGAINYNESVESKYQVKISAFIFGDGYRPLSEQSTMKNKQNSGTGNTAASVGKSPHGWGMAIDFCTNDHGTRCIADKLGKPHITKWGHGTGKATTNEVKWLYQYGRYYGFYGNFEAKLDKNGRTIGYKDGSDGSDPIYAETWHWNFKGKREAVKKNGTKGGIR